MSNFRSYLHTAVYWVEILAKILSFIDSLLLDPPNSKRAA